jgi:putative peptide zinc metalloprotease protein
MNLTEALDAVLPDLPQARPSRTQPPRLDPDLIVHDSVLDGEPIVGVLKRGKNAYFRLTPFQWQLLQLFDGHRSYAEIAQLFSSQSDSIISPEEVRAFTSEMEGSELWYESYQDKNLAMREKLLAERERRTKAKVNIAHISFSAWDPDRYFDWLDAVAGRFIYSRWSLLAAVLLFAVETVMVVNNWHMIGPDTATFFNFGQKNLDDLARFWILIMIVGFIHESAHGLTCKHYGGQVHSMGLMFLYLTPCFFVDVTESWVSATKIQRLATIIAGIWIELVVCGIAMAFWLHAPAGSWFHKLMYEFILLTGIAAVIINLNPLLKLDGYYFLTEIIEIPELKERSSAFVSAWIKAKIFRLSVDIPVVPRRRVVLFVVYAILSAAYSYLLLFFVLRFGYRIAARWIGEVALIPMLAIAFFMFRSRLKALGSLLGASWTHIRSTALWRRPVFAPALIGVGVLLFAPLWRDREHGYFVIEPVETHTICAAVPGQVVSVFVREGEPVKRGQPLLEMTSVQAASMQSAALARSEQAQFDAFNSEVQGQSIGTAAADQTAALRHTQVADEAVSSLVIKAPVDGTVLADNPAQLVYENVGYGQPLIRIAEGATVVRVFIPVNALRRVPPSAEVALQVPGQFSVTHLRLTPISGEPLALPAGLVSAEKYKGLSLPVFYSAVIPLTEKMGGATYGVSGRAILFGERRSVGQRIGSGVLNTLRSHIWW